MSRRPRLILVPQLPVAMRYSEWWWQEWIRGLSPYYDEVVLVSPADPPSAIAPGASFSPLKKSVIFESMQMAYLAKMELRPDDDVFLLDLSFSGITSMAAVLFMDRPVNWWAFCHASALNTYDVWEPVREEKFAIETAITKRLKAVFVASEYHRNKLSLWRNVWVTHALPPNPHVPWVGSFRAKERPQRKHYLGICCRDCTQKRDPDAMGILVHEGIGFTSHTATSWEDYVRFLKDCQYVLFPSLEETYGYGAQEALCCGAIPVAPRTLCFPEILPDECLYSNTHELLRILRNKELLTKELQLRNESHIAFFFEDLVKGMDLWREL